MGNPLPVSSHWHRVRQLLHFVWLCMKSTERNMFLCVPIRVTYLWIITSRYKSRKNYAFLFNIQCSWSIVLPFWKLPVKMTAFRSVTVFTVSGRRLVTQSCSLLSVAHTLTHQGWNTCHDQHAASGSQNKLLTVVSPCWLRSYNHSEPEWAEAECHPKSHSMLGNPNHRGAHVRNSTRSLRRTWGKTQFRCQRFWSQTGWWTRSTWMCSWPASSSSP